MVLEEVRREEKRAEVEKRSIKLFPFFNGPPISADGSRFMMLFRATAQQTDLT